MSFIDSTTFVDAYIAVMFPIVLCIGIWANVMARKASKR